MSRLAPLALALLAALSAAAGEPPLLIEGGTVVDVAEGRSVAGQAILVVDGRIAAIGSAAALRPPAGTRRVDASGLHVLPGLCDAHVHLSPSPETFGPLLVAHGVTWVRDLGGPADGILALRDAWADAPDRPRITCAGPILDGDPPVWGAISRVCATPAAGRAAVRDLAARGVDFLKVYSRLEAEVYAAILDEAGAVGLRVVGHVPEAVPLARALELGQATDEHLMGFSWAIARRLGVEEFEGVGPLGEPPLGLYDDLDPAARAAFLAEVRAAGMAQCPTLGVLRGYARAVEGADDPRLRYVPEAVRGFWALGAASGIAELAESAAPHQLRLTGDLHAAGVPILAGTDLANPYVFAGSSLHEELALLVEAGLEPAEALRAATLAPARAVGLADALGSIAPGKEGSLVLVRGDPLADVAAAAEVEAVVLRGRHLDRAALDALLAEAEAAAAGEGDEEAALELPGEELHRGRYVIRLGGREVGAEDFVSAETEDGLVFLSRASGGVGGPPAETRVTASPDLRRFRTATWTTAGEPPVEAAYAREDGALVVRVTAGGEDRAPERIALGDPPLLSPPAYAAAPLIMGQADLAPGEERAFQATAWGLAGPTPQTSPYTLTREPDAAYRLGGAEVQARRYRFQVASPFGVLAGESWLSADGRLLYATRLQLGAQTLEVTLEP